MSQPSENTRLKLGLKLIFSVGNYIQILLFILISFKKTMYYKGLHNLAVSSLYALIAILD